MIRGEDYGEFEKRVKKKLIFNCIMLAVFLVFWIGFYTLFCVFWVIFILLLISDIYYRKKY